MPSPGNVIIVRFAIYKCLLVLEQVVNSKIVKFCIGLIPKHNFKVLPERLKINAIFEPNQHHFTTYEYFRPFKSGGTLDLL
jgi:hypothetical protein